MLMCIASKLTSAAGSAPNLPLLRPAQYGQPRASLPSIVCCQMSTADTQRSASPIKRRPLLLGHGPNVPQVRLPHGKLGRAPSSPAITTCKPSSASPKVKVNWVENKLTAVTRSETTLYFACLFDNIFIHYSFRFNIFQLWCTIM